MFYFFAGALRALSHAIPACPLKGVHLSLLQMKKLGLGRVSTLSSRRSLTQLAPEPAPASTRGQPEPDSYLSLLFQALKRQSLLGLSFFNSILAHGDLRNNRLNQLSVNLWHLAQRHGCADTRTMVSHSPGPWTSPRNTGSCERHRPLARAQLASMQLQGRDIKEPSSSF